jgi:hypothetical protein
MESFALFTARMGGCTSGNYFFEGRTLWFRPEVRHSRTMVTFTGGWGGNYSQGPDQKIHTFTAAELRAVVKVYNKAKAEEKAKAEAKAAKTAAYEQWLAALADSQFPGWLRLDRQRGEFTDNVGNFLCFADQCTGMTRDQVVEYVGSLEIE